MTFIYGLIHSSKQCFKIGKARSIESRVSEIGKYEFYWQTGFAYAANSESHALKVERAAHIALGGWRLDGEVSVPWKGASEWFSTKGLIEFITWCHENENLLDIRQVPFHEACSFAAPPSRRNFYEDVFHIVQQGVEPKSRNAWLGLRHHELERQKTWKQREARRDQVARMERHVLREEGFSDREIDDLDASL